MKQADVIIILNRGGWGDGGIEREEQAQSILKGIQATLASLKLECEVLVFQRIDNITPRKALRAVQRVIAKYPKESEALSRTVENILEKAKRVRILLLGYSSGGVLNIEAMRRLISHSRVYALHIGTPFFSRYRLHPRILDLRKKYDLVARGHVATFLAGIIMGCLIGIIKMAALRTWHPTKAFSVPGHQYNWQDKNLRSAIQNFLKKHFRDTLR